MPKAAELLRFLQQQGYRKVRQTGSHLILEHSERPMLVVPIHRGDLPKGLFLKILKDAGFTLSQFRRK
jgi:predicted RNA binding protein YcfA (HicA-like mRNA interferase family)